jgi:hypothetical protein
MLSLLYHTCIAVWAFQLSLGLEERSLLYHQRRYSTPSAKRPSTYSSYARAPSANEVVAKAFACLGRACRLSQTRRLPHGIKTTAFIRVKLHLVLHDTPLDLHPTPPCHHQGRGTAVR